MDTHDRSAPWLLFGAEFVGTALLGVAVYRVAGPRWLTVEVAKLYHFKHDRYGVFRWNP